MNKNKPVWEIQQEVPQVVYRRMTIDAQNGEVVSEKTDWLYGVER